MIRGSSVEADELREVVKSEQKNAGGCLAEAAGQRAGASARRREKRRFRGKNARGQKPGAKVGPRAFATTAADKTTW